MARGDIFYVELPSPRSSASHEQAGRRLAVAVQTDVTVNRLSTVTIVPFTTSPAASRYPYTIKVTPSVTNGLTQPSILLVFQIRAIDKRRILNMIGSLEPSYLDLLDAEIKNLLNLT